MDIRVMNLPRLRIVLKPEQKSAWVGSAGECAEAMAQIVGRKIRPLADLFFNLRRRLATIAVAVVTVWLFAHVMLGANGMMVYRTKRVEVQSLQKEIDSLQAKNDRYNKQIENLKTDPKTIEKEARERLHYARPGEVVYVTPTPAAQDVPRIDSAQK